MVVAASLHGGTTRAATSLYRYDERLSRIARETLWQAASEGTGIKRAKVLSVGVRCYRDRDAFEETFQGLTGLPARRVIAYYAGGRDMHLRGATCANVHRFFRGRNTVVTAGAYAILLHEALHRQGVRNERLTTCFANESVRWGTRWFGGSEAKSLRARNRAFTYTRLYAPRSYRMGRPDCLALARRKEWVEFARDARAGRLRSVDSLELGPQRGHSSLR